MAYGIYKQTAVSTHRLREIWDINEKLNAHLISYISQNSTQFDFYVRQYVTDISLPFGDEARL